MEYKWLNKTLSSKLIIFFNGWGMDDYIVSHLKPDDYDVLMVYDYNSLCLNFDKEQLSQYKERHIIAWSMGVMVATLFDFNVDSAVAVCGTTLPIDDDYGIPKKIYNLTVKGFSSQSCQKFMDRMFKNKPNITKFSDRNLENIKSELISLFNYNSNPKFRYTKAIVGDEDKIILAKNQLKFWEKIGLKLLVINSGHCPFYLYEKWSELL